jgi:hypothetical protein
MTCTQSPYLKTLHTCDATLSESLKYLFLVSKTELFVKWRYQTGFKRHYHTTLFPLSSDYYVWPHILDRHKPPYTLCLHCDQNGRWNWFALFQTECVWRSIRLSFQSPFHISPVAITAFAKVIWALTLHIFTLRTAATRNIVPAESSRWHMSVIEVLLRTQVFCLMAWGVV